MAKSALKSCAGSVQTRSTENPAASARTAKLSRVYLWEDSVWMFSPRRKSMASPAIETA